MRIVILTSMIGLAATLTSCTADDEPATDGAAGTGADEGTGGAGADGGAGGAGADGGGMGGAASPFDFPCESQGRTIVAAQDGSGDHDTVQACVDALSPGDTCLVQPGVYSERVDVSGLEGTETACITVRGEPGAVLDGEGASQSLFYTYGGGAWFVIEGFEIRGSLGDGSIFLRDVDHVILRDNVIHGTFDSAEGIYGGGGCDHVIIEDNEIYDVTGKEGIYFAWPDESAPPNTNIVIRRNTLHDIALEGVDLKNCSDVLVAENHLERTGNVSEFGLGVSVTGGTHSVEIRGNTFLDMGMGQGRTERGAAILTGEGDHPASDVTITGNVIHGGDFAGVFLRGGPSHRFEHNTVANLGLQGVDLACFDPGCGGAVLKRNVVVFCAGAEIDVGDGSDGQPLESDYNLAFDGAGTDLLHGYATPAEACTSTGFECHSVVADPAFVDLDGGDFHLTADSPACGAGESDTDLGAHPCP
jgi:hypothetical protein